MFFFAIKKTFSCLNCNEFCDIQLCMMRNREYIKKIQLRCRTSRSTLQLQCQHQWTCTTWPHPRAPRCRPAVRHSSAQSPSCAERCPTTTTTRSLCLRVPRATGKRTQSATPCWQSCPLWSRPRWHLLTTVLAAAPPRVERARRRASTVARKWRSCPRKQPRGLLLWPFLTTTRTRTPFCRF